MESSSSGAIRLYAILRRKTPWAHCLPSCCRSILYSATRQFSGYRNVQQHQPAAQDSPSKQQGQKVREKTAERDLFLSVLSATATKRDARSYLSQFTRPTVGDISSPWTQDNTIERPFRIALIKIRAPQELDDVILEGLAQTIAQLVRLGLSCVIVIDTTLDIGTITSPIWREEAVIQSDRLMNALQKDASIRARRLDYAMGVTPHNGHTASRVSIRGDVEVQYPDVLFGSLQKGAIPIIPPIGYMTETQKMMRVEPDDVILALTRLFAGLRPGVRQNASEDGNISLVPRLKVGYPKHFSLDRIILLDPLGGMPSATRPDNSHIFINLEQEYDDIRRELLSAKTTERTASAAIQAQPNENVKISIFGVSNPVTKLLETEQPLVTTSQIQKAIPNQVGTLVTNRNVMNLDLLQKALALLPPSSSALLTTPYEASTQSANQDPPTELGVITRRPRNPLIYNLLTDKPLVSSSLPASRLGASVDRKFANNTQPIPATFVKRGMPLTMIPNPRLHIWEAPDMSKPQLSLNDPRIDLPRLLNLIEDSFGRPLNIEHYLNRIRNKIAGIIVAGEYEGGAILTWELPPGVPDDDSERSRLRMVPYLDKFAVLKRSQGAGGVADIVFSAMVRSCFPHGVCWRSRKDNPVNRWYFERSVGTWKIPKSNWTMFWTTEGLLEDKQTFLDYAGVCRGVLPSWADNKAAD